MVSGKWVTLLILRMAHNTGYFEAFQYGIFIMQILCCDIHVRKDMQTNRIWKEQETIQQEESN